MNNYEKAINILDKYNQTDIKKELEKNKKEELINQILNIDFDKMNTLYENAKQENRFSNDIIENIEYKNEYKLTKEELEKYNQIGEKIIRKGKYAVVTMAGGQGTRLGVDGPKGTFKINVKEGEKSLFEIIADTLKRQNEKYKIIIPWYIMTSKENNKATEEFFKKEKNFGYPKEMIKFFIQGELPLLDLQGNMILNEEGLIKEASDGNGSIYKSMKKNKIIEDMESKQIEWIYICSVDNILLKIIEPVLLGLTISQNNLIASKTIAKENPYEKVGVFCKKNKRPAVIEYTELSEEMSEMRDENGELVFGESHIMCNLFNIQVIKEIANKELPYHTAVKKVNYIKDNTLIEPKDANVYKFEAFIFDAFSYYDNMTLLRGKRKEDFAPIKNKIGSDSPQTAIKLYNEYFYKNK